MSLIRNENLGSQWVVCFLCEINEMWYNTSFSIILPLFHYRKFCIIQIKNFDNIKSEHWQRMHFWVSSWILISAFDAKNTLLRSISCIKISLSSLFSPLTHSLFSSLVKSILYMHYMQCTWSVRLTDVVLCLHYDSLFCIIKKWKVHEWTLCTWVCNCVCNSGALFVAFE